MAKTSNKWLKTKDGIWPMLVRDVVGGQIYVTKYARGDWRWTVFVGHSGTSKKSTGRATTQIAACNASLAAVWP